MPRWMNAANGLTALRLLLTPPIVAAMWTGRHGLALALFMIAAATDVLDGAAARRAVMAFTRPGREGGANRPPAAPSARGRASGR